jgi:hypothetical protein
MRKGDVYLADLDPTLGQVTSDDTFGLPVPGGDGADRSCVSFHAGYVCKVISKIRLAWPSCRWWRWSETVNTQTLRVLETLRVWEKALWW